MDFVQDADDDVIESTESETESDDNNSISSENSDETNEIIDLEEATETLGNNRVKPHRQHFYVRKGIHHQRIICSEEK